MDSKEFKTYCESSIKKYAQEKIRVATWSSATAEKQAAAEFQRLLPQGAATPANYLLKIIMSADVVGNLWLARVTQEPTTAYIYDFEILPAFQNQGLDTQAINLSCKFAQQHGFTKIRLHVFGGNQRAVHVYQKANFVTTDIMMERKL
ncbi:MAG: GNAT family N-acetyltransferase [Liquorilactobacillus ghanensis]|uniref:GNAT family N-acetyltransferase n=1 Tax=Liquorilactobacillus ghanensis TaxID=399370 RepID=UPI0039E939D5